MLTPYLKLLMDGSYLEKKEAETAMTLILESADPHQIAAFLTILKYRGETSTEILGMVEALQKKTQKIKLESSVLDIVGTGGDLANTVNISTGSAILAAACGIPVAKHGNRSVSSQSGSADVLEEFGINIETSPEDIPQYLREVGIAFMFAPTYHPSLKRVSSIRKSLKLPTVFNILGPLLNPAKADYSLIGVAKESNLELMSQVILNDISKKRSLVFHGNGLDELTPLGKTIAYDICDGQMRRLELDPMALGFIPCTLKDLQGGDAKMNATILRKAFEGEQSAVADTLAFNAGAALWIFGRTQSLVQGIQDARRVLQQGKAIEVLEKWIQLSNQLKHRKNNERD